MMLFYLLALFLYARRSDCEGGCGGSGFQHRERDVLSPPTGNGRKCPSLEEVRPCETPPCPKDRLADFMAECGLADPRGMQGGEMHEIVWLLPLSNFLRSPFSNRRIISALSFTPYLTTFPSHLIPLPLSVTLTPTRTRRHLGLVEGIARRGGPGGLVRTGQRGLDAAGPQGSSRASWLHGLLVASCLYSDRCCLYL